MRARRKVAPPPHRAWTAMLVVCMLLSACGSTVQVGQDGSGPAAAVGGPVVAGADGLTAPAPGTGTTAVDPVTGAPVGGGSGAGGLTAGSPAGSQGAGTSTAGGAGGQSSAGSGGGSGGQPAQGGAGGGNRAVGSGTEPIRLGFIVLKNGEAFVSGLGTEVSFGNGRDQVRAMVDEVNATGGIAGHPIEPFFAEVDAAAADRSSDYAAACAKLTQDDEVFAMLTPINVYESVVACAAQARTPLLNASFNPGDDYLYQQFGAYFYSPSLLSLNNGVRLMLSTLRSEGALKSGVKVGVMYTDQPQYKRVMDTTFVPTLEAYGVEYQVAAAGANNAAQINNAQLQFATAGVDIVMFVAPNGINQLLFMQQAEQQGFRPKYFTTDPDSTRFVSQNAPRAQARNIRGVGTLPISNVPATQYPSNAQEQACLEIMRKRSGENPADRLSSLTATLYCELVWEFAAVTERVRGPLTVDAWRAAYPAVGRAYRPVSTFGMDLGTGRHDNATLYRPYGWSTRCNCLSYTGKARPIPRS